MSLQPTNGHQTQSSSEVKKANTAQFKCVKLVEKHPNRLKALIISRGGSTKC